ncbi:MAG: hypothetical protein HOV80_37265 [Polyangiaceae bacterium]|nr:hypothetical protein [Polyangiaceae bacterium]
MKRALGIFSLLLLSFPATALADDAAAQRHFEAGQVAFVKRHYEEAANEFEAAHAESPHPAALFNAGVAWSQAGKAAHAANCLSTALAGEGLSTEQTTDAKKRLAAATPSLAKIKVTAPRGSVVRLDDHCPASPPVELFAEEGDHVVSVVLRDGKRLTRQVTAPAAGGSRSIDIRPEEKVAPPVTPPSPPPQEAEPWLNGRRIAGFAVLGGSVALGAAALGVGVTGLGKRDDFVDGGRVDQDLHDDALFLRDTANVLWGVSAGALVVGTLLVALPSMGNDEEKPTALQVRVGAGSAMLSGAW